MITDFKVGQKVFFGRSFGEKTLGEIVKINPSKLKIKQLEDRGSIKNYPVGTIWTVPPSLVSPVEGNQTAPKVTIPEPATFNFKVGDRVSFTKGSKTITGTIATINARTVTLKDTNDGSPGWRVSPGMLSPAASESSKGRPEKQIMRDISDIYNQLSPENLFADGERDRVQALQLRNKLNAKLRMLFQEIGRVVNEEEAFGF